MWIFKKKDPSHFTKRIYNTYLILITVSIISVTTYQQLDFRNHILADKRQELYNIAESLDQQLHGSYDEILIKEGALDLNKQDKIKVINKTLQPIINKFTNMYPDIGMGYYDSALQSRVAFGPEFDMEKINSVPEEVKDFYNSRTPQFAEIGNSTIWEGQAVLTLSYPIFRNGTMIGRVFANIKTTDMYAHIWNNAIYVTIFCLIVLFIFNWFSWFYTKKVNKELARFTDSIIRNNTATTENLLPELKPIAMQISHYQDEVITSALENERLKTITQLSAGLANDIRNPLTTIKGFLQLLSENLNNHEKEYVEISLSEVDSVNALITRMLYLAQPPESNFSSTDVTYTINGIIKLIRPIADLKGIVINADIQEDLPWVIADLEQLNKIFLNVFYNAFDNINDNLGVINIRAFEQDNNVCIDIKDNGKGIMKENIKKVFDPLFTTKNNGSGLGLAICKDIIARHGGQIDINSKYGKGTTVKLQIPIVKQLV